MIIFDCDGTISDGNILFPRWDAKDGAMLKKLSRRVPVIVITGNADKRIKKRCKWLGIKAYLGVTDKLEKVQKICAKSHIKMKDVIYVGDDYNDIEVMEQVGECYCPQDAIPEVKSLCDYVSPYKAGYGAVADIIKLIGGEYV